MEKPIRQRIYWNDGWGFAPAYDPALLGPDFDQKQLTPVRLPNTTRELPLHYFDESLYQTVCGYRRVFVPEESWRDRRVLLTVEAAAHEAQVFLNGQCLLTHRCGYTAFGLDLAPYLRWGEENVLVIRVDSRECLNIPPFGKVIDYMTFSGLYREVYLDICPRAYIRDVFPKVLQVRPGSDGVTGSAELECEIQVEGAENGTIRQTLLPRSGGGDIRLNDGQTRQLLENVELWSPEHPALYTLRTELYLDGVLADVYSVTTGLRKVDFQAQGLYINGRRVRLRGLNRHQSFPYVGYAMPRSMQRKDAEILKYELGVNAVRTSHYPQSHHFLDRCDELGLLVFTEIPGWQHIGEGEWREQAVRNTQEMVLQYRNHPSIFLWGVRINESVDCDELYRRTNEAAHLLDSTRPTSGVRFQQKSNLLEDVYAYNDFSHDGSNGGCLKKAQVTSDTGKGYLISEYNGHMFPTKSFDCEEHRVEQLRRHARVMDGWYSQQDIAGGFGWCMFDYNTHKDFGSGDRVCYHGVMDAFRNPKLAAAVYAAQGADKTVLEVSSAMDIGEHPACLMQEVYAVTNADSVRLYKNGQFVGDFDSRNSPYPHLPHPPILIDDFIGPILEQGEGFSHRQAEDVKKILLAANRYGLAHLPLSIKLLAAKCILRYGMSMDQAVSLYNKYIGNWGGASTSYRFEAIKDGQVAAVSEKTAVRQVRLRCQVSHTTLLEASTYDVSSVRIQAVSESGDVLPYYQEPLLLETQGPIALIGPAAIALQGGMGGTYVKTLGAEGTAVLRIRGSDTPPVELHFEIKRG